MVNCITLLVTVGIYMAYASDPSPLQDFCVGVTDPNTAWSLAMMINVTRLPSLNTLGVSVARVDYALGGVNPPHFHPRFVTANRIDGGNKLFATVLKKGDLCVFPQGLIHFQINIGKTNAVASVAFGSQNPALVTVANSVFGSHPHIHADVLSKAFHLDDNSLGGRFYFLIGVLAMVGLYMAHAADPVFVNGLYCKSPADVTAEDFAYRGYNTPGDTRNQLGSFVMMINDTILPSLNTLGLTVARVDYAPGGVEPPHLHPRASEILTVIEGTLHAGFITSNRIDGSNKLFATELQKGDLFVFPQGLIHFHINRGKTKAVANVAFGSQNPGVVTVAKAVFGSDPPIGVDVLSRAFRVHEDVIEEIRSEFTEIQSEFNEVAIQQQ
ncbi:hypothetical protein Cgig2_030579 [Carnegiea gigantea]|uniref:Cupin type-1 domain-containing protein n=1 Tax=Carnegiea gigantea TaxID=171969 RepID=A0A9Q1GY57_9CARY|nr:hypothetical protein Cgig2_030579 [Carnegiea gigantea]